MTNDTPSEPTIWHSDCLRIGNHNPPEFLDWTDENTASDRVDANGRLQRGFPVERQELAKYFSTKHASFDNAPLPFFFSFSGPCMTEAFADVLRGFDLGEVVFYPIDIERRCARRNT
ncbi:MAG: hypothetical protein AAGC79_16405 [Pseudomonadota bacterium]